MDEFVYENGSKKLEIFFLLSFFGKFLVFFFLRSDKIEKENNLSGLIVNNYSLPDFFFNKNTKFKLNLTNSQIHIK